MEFGFGTSPCYACNVKNFRNSGMKRVRVGGQVYRFHPKCFPKELRRKDESELAGMGPRDMRKYKVVA